MEIILASASPRRKELLQKIIPLFEVIPSEVDENIDVSDPYLYACKVAEHKCDKVFESNQNKVVIGCDTIVVYKGKILGKPKNSQDAMDTLKGLSGQIHEVITGVCVRHGDKKYIDYDKTQVLFNDLSQEFIKSYVASGSPLDKAGSYGIQDGGIVKEYVGSFTNVVGFPLELVEKMLKNVCN